LTELWNAPYIVVGAPQIHDDNDNDGDDDDDDDDDAKSSR